MSGDDQSMGGEFGSLGSLKKQARGKSLRGARIALVVAGILIALIGMANLFTAEKQIDDVIKKDLRESGLVIVDQAKHQEFRNSAVKLVQLVASGMVAIAVILIVMAILVYRYPLFCTIGGLILYIGFNLVIAFLLAAGEGGDPMRFLISHWPLKLLILVGLSKGIHSAVAHHREMAEERSQAAFTPQAEI